VRCRWCTGCDPKGEVLQCHSLAPSLLHLSGCWRDSRRSSQAALLLLYLSCLLGFRGRLALFLLLVAGQADAVAVVTAGAGSLHLILKFCLSFFPSSTSLHQPPFSRHLMYIVRAWEAAGLRTELLLLDEANRSR
jgi:hypothetical protein